MIILLKLCSINANKAAGGVKNNLSLVFRSVPFCDDCKIIAKQHILCGIEDLLNLCVRFSISGLLLGAPPTR